MTTISNRKYNGNHNSEKIQDDLNIPNRPITPNKSRLRKNSIVENEAGVDTTIIKICFTGGPCAGKTTAIT